MSSRSFRGGVVGAGVALAVGKGTKVFSGFLTNSSSMRLGCAAGVVVDPCTGTTTAVGVGTTGAGTVTAGTARAPVTDDQNLSVMSKTSLS